MTTTTEASHASDEQETTTGDATGADSAAVTEAPKTFDQEAVNAIVKARLAEQNAKLSARLEQDFAKRLEAALADASTKAETTITERVAAELTTRELAAARKALADSYGLSEAQVAKLDGTTSDDLKASAELLFGALRTRQAPIIVPGGGSPPMATFTRAQLKDFTFFQAHKADILRAQAEGRITD